MGRGQSKTPKDAKMAHMGAYRFVLQQREDDQRRTGVVLRNAVECAKIDGDYYVKARYCPIAKDRLCVADESYCAGCVVTTTKGKIKENK